MLGVLVGRGALCVFIPQSADVILISDRVTNKLPANLESDRCSCFDTYFVLPLVSLPRRAGLRAMRASDAVRTSPSPLADRYKTIAPICLGTAASVFRVRDWRSGRVLAAKVLAPQNASMPVVNSPL